MVRRSWGEEGQQSGSRAGIGTGQTSTLRATAVAAFRQFNTASSLGWLRQQTSHMDDNSPTNTTTITSRRDQTDITQLTAKPATQDWTSHAARTRTEGGSGRAPSKHGRAAHARRGHEQDAETRPRTLARPSKAVEALYTQLSSLYTQKQHPHAAKQNTPAAQPRRRSTPKRRPNQRRPSETTERENQDDSHRSRAYLLERSGAEIRESRLYR